MALRIDLSDTTHELNEFHYNSLFSFCLGTGRILSEGSENAARYKKTGATY